MTGSRQAMDCQAAAKGRFSASLVTDHASDGQLGIVEGRAEGVGKGVTQFTALMDRPGGFGPGKARYAARSREAMEQALHTGQIARHVGIDALIAAIQPAARQYGGSAMPRTTDE